MPERWKQPSCPVLLSSLETASPAVPQAGTCDMRARQCGHADTHQSPRRQGSPSMRRAMRRLPSLVHSSRIRVTPVRFEVPRAISNEHAEPTGAEGWPDSSQDCGQRGNNSGIKHNICSAIVGADASRFRGWPEKHVHQTIVLTGIRRKKRAARAVVQREEGAEERKRNSTRRKSVARRDLLDGSETVPADEMLGPMNRSQHRRPGWPLCSWPGPE
jgi:hypothetical protein